MTKGKGLFASLTDEQKEQALTYRGEETHGDSVIWGAKNIAKVIGRTEQSTFHMLERGTLPGAKKVGGRWGLNPRVFFATFEEDGR